MLNRLLTEIKIPFYAHDKQLIAFVILAISYWDYFSSHLYLAI
jgi:hypothetical protein